MFLKELTCFFLLLVQSVQRNKISTVSEDKGEQSKRPCVLCSQLLDMAILVTQLQHKAKHWCTAPTLSAIVPNKSSCTQQHADTKVMRFISSHEN